jgi:hypothetical protein
MVNKRQINQVKKDTDQAVYLINLELHLKQ